MEGVRGGEAVQVAGGRGAVRRGVLWFVRPVARGPGRGRSQRPGYRQGRGGAPVSAAPPAAVLGVTVGVGGGVGGGGRHGVVTTVTIALLVEVSPRPGRHPALSDGLAVPCTPAVKTLSTAAVPSTPSSAQGVSTHTPSAHTLHTLAVAKAVTKGAIHSGIYGRVALAMLCVPIPHSRRHDDGDLFSNRTGSLATKTTGKFQASCTKLNSIHCERITIVNSNIPTLNLLLCRGQNPFCHP